MSLHHSPLKLESDQKDLLISELKAENFELKNKERHYNQMYDTIMNIEHEGALIHQEKRAMEEEMRRRSDSDSISIRRLREENESLLRAHRDIDEDIMAIRDEIAHLRSINDSKAREIGELDTSIAIRSDDNAGLRDKIKDVERFIVREWDDGRALRIDLAKTNQAIDATSKDIAVTNNIIKSREHDIDELNKRISKRNLDISDKRANIADAEDEIARLNDDIGKAKYDQDKLGCRLDDEVDRTGRLQKENSDHIKKGAALSADIRDLSSKCANRDAQIAVMRGEIDKLTHSLKASDSCNCNLEEELDAMNKHSDMLHYQNNILDDELTKALADEEYVRKEKLAMVKQDNDQQLRNSLNMLSEVKSRSPIRKR